MIDDVVLAKAAVIERCASRAREELAASVDFDADLTRQDAAILNIQRACEAAIDLALRIVRLRRLGAPASSREAVDLIRSAELITPELAVSLKRMVGFRNVAVHRYTDLEMAVVERIIRHGLDDLLMFAAVALRLDPEPRTAM